MDRMEQQNKSMTSHIVKVHSQLHRGMYLCRGDSLHGGTLEGISLHGDTLRYFL